VRYLPLLLVLLVACDAPPTRPQVTSRAIIRNCEAQGAVAADEIRKQNIQMMKEGSGVDAHDSHEVELRAEQVREQAFKSCMLKYSV
jgi:hypothetical protein